MNETHEATGNEMLSMSEARPDRSIGHRIAEAIPEVGEFLNDDWAAEFDRRLAAWDADTNHAAHSTAVGVLSPTVLATVSSDEHGPLADAR
jgi:hypothetical protein